MSLQRSAQTNVASLMIALSVFVVVFPACEHSTKNSPQHMTCNTIISAYGRPAFIAASVSAHESEIQFTGLQVVYDDDKVRDDGVVFVYCDKETTEFLFGCVQNFGPISAGELSYSCMHHCNFTIFQPTEDGGSFRETKWDKVKTIRLVGTQRD